MVNITRNITTLYRKATAEQVAMGLSWYEEAHNLAQSLAEQHGVTLEVAAGVIAALSPINSWGVNKALAAKFLEAGGMDEGYLATGLRKARAIMEGADPEITLMGVRGQKTAAFYAGIVSCGNTDRVCVDRHAFDLAVNHKHTDATRPNLAGKRYAEVAEKYRRAAEILSKEVGPISAAQVQAVTWVAWRQKHWSVGAFDGR